MLYSKQGQSLKLYEEKVGGGETGVSTFGGIDVRCNYSRLQEKKCLSCETTVMNVSAHYL